jgi:phage anti-repressor protein
MAIYVNKAKAQFYLSTPDSSQWFYLQNGNMLKNIYDLRTYFEKVSPEEYKKYVYNQNNDFYNWVMGVFGNEKLGESLKKARSPKEAYMYTDRNIKMLERNSQR